MKPDAPKPQQATLQTVERAFSFLEYVASATEPPTVQMVASALGLNITTCYHLLRTLVARGYIARNDDLTLTLGSGVNTLFRTYQRTFNVDETLAQLVKQLSAATSETAYLSVLEGQSVILTVLAEGTQPLRVSGLFVGQSGNEHIRSSGKAVLAHLDDSDRDDMLARVLRDELPRARKALIGRLAAELDLTKRRGWSMDEQGSDIGIASVGAPVFDGKGAIYGAIGVVTPSTRMDRFQDFFVDAVTSTAANATGVLASRSTG